MNNSTPGAFVVALTGGIAAGKTAVSDEFARLGVPVIDTDVIARELVEPGQELLNSIVGTFGRELLDAYGRLKRKSLRELIFSNPEKRLQLEALMHPRIAEEATRQISEVTAPYCLLVIPLLTEARAKGAADRVLVIDAPEEVRIERIMARDDSTREQAEAVLAAQASREERLKLADDVIENSGTLSELTGKVATLHEQYTELAKSLQEDSSPER